MSSLATIGALIEVTPWDTLQYWPTAESSCSFIDDPTPFRFRVAGELKDHGFFFGLHGPVESGPERFLNLICSILLRQDESDWHTETACAASFKVAPSVAWRDPEYEPKRHSDVPFFQYPGGTSTEGYPKISRFGGIHVVSESAGKEDAGQVKDDKVP